MVYFSKLGTLNKAVYTLSDQVQKNVFAVR